jgi:hypothetical protein
MPLKLLLEQFHLNVYVPRGLPAAEGETMRRTLKAAGYLAVLRRAVAAVFGRSAALRRATFDISK